MLEENSCQMKSPRLFCGNREWTEASCVGHRFRSAWWIHIDHRSQTAQWIGWLDYSGNAMFPTSLGCLSFLLPNTSWAECLSTFCGGGGFDFS